MGGLLAMKEDAGNEVQPVTVTQEKVLFVWNEPRPKVAIPGRLKFRPIRSEDMASFTSVVARVLQGSLDTYDRARLLRLSAHDFGSAVR